MTSIGISYTLTASHIHDFILHDVQHSTLDLFYAKMEEIITTTPLHEPLLMRLDVAQIPSIQYMASHARLVRQKHPQSHKTRIAVLYPQALQVFLLNMVGRSLTHRTPLKLFLKDQAEQAEAWLLEQIPLNTL